MTVVTGKCRFISPPCDRTGPVDWVIEYYAIAFSFSFALSLMKKYIVTSFLNQIFKIFVVENPVLLDCLESFKVRYRKVVSEFNSKTNFEVLFLLRT